MTADDSKPANAGSPSEPADQSRAERRALEVESAHRRKRRTAMVLAPLLLISAAGTGFALWNRDGDTPGDQAGAARTGFPSTPSAPAGSQAPSAGAVSPSSAKNCPNRTPVTVWVPAALAPTLSKTATDFQATDVAPCVTYTVAAKNPTQTLDGLVQGKQGRPDAWVSDASVWVDQVNAAGKLKVNDRTPFAMSPLVVAMNPARAATLKTAPTWAQIIKPGSPIAISNPLSTTAGMLTIASALPRLSLRQGRTVIPQLAAGLAPSTEALFKAFDDTPSAAPAFTVSEAALLAHNQAKPSRRLVPVSPEGGTRSFEYSLVTISNDAARSKAVDALAQWLTGPQAATVLTAGGFRASGGTAKPASIKGAVGTVSLLPSPNNKQFGAAVDTWKAATLDFSLLIAFDVSGSMNYMIGSGTRAAVTQKAAGIALSALPVSTRLGLWVFSATTSDKGKDYREIVPFGLLSDPSHRARVAKAAGHLTDEVGGGTGLYDTIWAAYQKAQSNYDGKRLNAVVILTDGRNDDPAGISLAQLKAKLRAAADPKRPVAVTTIGIGPGVDAKPLSEISRMTSSKYWGAPTAADITTVLKKALFDHSCKNGVCV